MSGAAVGLIVVIACAAFFIISRGKRLHATGAFRNRPSSDAGAYVDGGSDRDANTDFEGGDSGDSGGGDGVGGGDGGGGDE